MNELEAKCYLTKKGGANNSDHTCMYVHQVQNKACLQLQNIDGSRKKTPVSDTFSQKCSSYVFQE